jgi:hypothetical protein
MNVEKTRIQLDIKHNIEQRMRKMNMSKRELSTFLGIKENTLLMKLAGKRGISLEEGVMISKFLEISMDELFIGKKVNENELNKNLEIISKSILDISYKIYALEILMAD